MLDAASGTFRIRSTGESRGERRSIVATFRRSSFLDYLYFTDYETSDPLTYPTRRRARRRRPGVHPVPRRRGRRTATTSRSRPSTGSTGRCTPTTTCSPAARRTSAATRRTRSRSPARRRTAGTPRGLGCGGTPDFLGIKRHPAPILPVPTSNTKLKDMALSNGKTYYGQTTVELLASGKMNVRSYNNTTGAVFTETAVDTPANGVVYVQQNARLGCSSIDGPLETDYTDPPGCAILTVKGTYTKSLTLASDADILIDGDLLRSGDPVLGLVALNFVRIKHGVRNCGGTLLRQGGLPRAGGDPHAPATRSSSTTTTRARSAAPSRSTARSRSASAGRSARSTPARATA